MNPFLFPEQAALPHIPYQGETAEYQLPQSDPSVKITVAQHFSNSSYNLWISSLCVHARGFLDVLFQNQS